MSRRNGTTVRLTSLRQGYGGPPKLQRRRKPDTAYGPAEAGHYVLNDNLSYGTMTSCEAWAENGVNVALRPNRSVAVTV